MSEKIAGMFMRENVVAEMCNLASELYEKSRYGEKKGDRFSYSLLEALYLVEREKMDVYSGRKKLDFDAFLGKAQRLEAGFRVRYEVFKDLRNRGYIVKTALKFGADFRVYDKGVKPGEDHARWIVYPVFGSEKLTWFDFSAKNRVAHSTKKKLLMAVVDDEGDVTYYEVGWVKP
ncbi:MAG: tRNA-intron lyase [archaeon]